MFEFWSRGSRTATREADDLAMPREVREAGPAPAEAPGTDAIGEAMRIIQKHVDREARNRWVEHLEVRDLCPRQKADLVSELAAIFR